MLAATDPARVRSLIWFVPAARSVWAPDYPWGARPDYVESDQAALQFWGTPEYGPAFRATEATGGHELVPGLNDAAIGFLSRHTATPDVAAGIASIWYQTDIRGLLSAIQCPTLLIADPQEPEEADHVASLIPEASVFTHPGAGSIDDLSKVNDFMAEIRRFLGVETPVPGLETILTTVLFTDIVNSTEKQAALGDRGWKELVERHHGLVRSALERWRGVENDTAGDGFYVTFDGPARAIRCALELTDRVRDLGVEIRAGIHTGECELVDGKAAGISVTTGSRISSLAGDSEVLVSDTVKGLVAGSGFSFEDAGEHELKGVPDRWRLCRVVDG